MRRGYTLVEMLVVVAIMVILVALALVGVRYVTEGGRVRESSRILSALFATARAKAVQTGRPCGVELVCEAPVGDASVRQATKAFLAEVQQPYSGRTTDARAKIQSGRFVIGTDAGGSVNVDAGEMAVLGSLVGEGETMQVRFDYKGLWYRVRRGKTGDANYPDPQTYTLIDNVLPIPLGVLQPFQIRRSPKRTGKKKAAPTR